MEKRFLCVVIWQAPLTEGECISLSKAFYLSRDKKVIISMTLSTFSVVTLMELFKRKKNSLDKLFNWMSSDLLPLVFCFMMVFLPLGLNNRLFWLIYFSHYNLSPFCVPTKTCKARFANTHTRGGNSNRYLETAFAKGTDSWLGPTC
jgi:hypothetical protein